MRHSERERERERERGVKNVVKTISRKRVLLWPKQLLLNKTFFESIMSQVVRFRRKAKGKGNKERHSVRERERKRRDTPFDLRLKRYNKGITKHTGNEKELFDDLYTIFVALLLIYGFVHRFGFLYVFYCSGKEKREWETQIVELHIARARQLFQKVVSESNSNKLNRNC